MNYASAIVILLYFSQAHTSLPPSAILKVMSKTLFPLLLGAALLIGFWLNTLRAREMANKSARLTCARLGFQFLDGTVALLQWQIMKGRLSVRRTYQFEYSDNGNNRQKGVIIIAANSIESVILAP